MPIPPLSAVPAPASPLAAALRERLPAAYAPVADPAAAAHMRAYMRDRFPFLGIQMPVRERIDRAVLAELRQELPAPREDDLVAVSLLMWAADEREYQYFAVRLLRRHLDAASAELLPTLATLITTKSWWDTVDELAKHVVGPLVLRQPDLHAELDVWAAGGQVWLARAAILHQLAYRERTDPERLFAYCLAQAGSGEFFLRKAIGWALREYSKTDPAAVERFVAAHHDRLSPLSRREALRLLTRG
jgi:3-methyladenine DNA glycosylase AlkD